jgi:hypothetical protein
MNNELTKRLIYAKYLLKRAANLHADDNELASAGAVLTAHDSAEMVMLVVIEELKLSSFRNFSEFWKLVKESTGKEPPRKAAMDRLNHARVGLKHKGILPNPKVVADFLRTTTTFCEEIARDYLAIDYETVSLADLVQNPDARTHVKKAESSKSNSDLKTALEELAIAYKELDSEANKKHEDELIGQIRLPDLGGTPSFEIHELHHQLEQMGAVVDALILGVDLTKYRKFVTIVPVAQRYADNHVEIMWLRDSAKISDSDYDFCYEFVMDFALKMATV